MAPNWRTEPQVSGTADCTEAITGSNHQIGVREGRLGPVTAGRTTTVSARAEPPVRTPPYIGAGLHLVIAWRTTGPPLYCGRRVAQPVIAPRTTGHYCRGKAGGSAGPWFPGSVLPDLTPGKSVAKVVIACRTTGPYSTVPWVVRSGITGMGTTAPPGAPGKSVANPVMAGRTTSIYFKT